MNLYLEQNKYFKHGKGGEKWDMRIKGGTPFLYTFGIFPTSTKKGQKKV